MSLGIGGGTQSQSSNMSQNVLSSGSTSKVLTPYQSALQSPLFTLIRNIMTNPGQTVAPLITQAKNSITSGYKGAAEALRQKFMGTPSGGESGKYGTATLQTDLQRQGDLSNADITGAATASQLPLSAASMASNLLGENFGQTYSGAQDTTGKSSGTGSNFSAGLKLG